jgi:RNA polymerase sigma-70 factor, ECF subfamily
LSSTLMKSLQVDASEQSLRALYRTYGGELYGFAVNCLGDRGLAEELVQEVFTRVWRNADKFDPDRATFRTWLYGIARNAVIDFNRRRAVRPSLAAYDADADPEALTDSIEQSVLSWQVAAALERLTPEHRQMIRMAQFRGLTMREIAAHTGLPLGTVKSRTWYALRSLRLAFAEMGVTPS